MKKILSLLVFSFSLLVFVSPLCAQNNDSKNIERYKQLVKTTGQSYETGSNKITSWGFTVNMASALDVLTMRTIPFLSNNEKDSTGFALSVLEEKTIIGMSLFVRGYDPVSMFARAKVFSDAQSSICEKQGLTNYVCAVKGKFKAIMPKSHAELMELLKTLDPADVKQILEMYKSEDKKVAATFLYENKRYGKKKPKEGDAIEITISQSDSRAATGQ